MKRKKSILTLISVVLVFFLTAPVLIRSLQASINPDFKGTCLTANSGTPSKLDSQFPFEEREKEENTSTHSLTSLPLLAVLPEPFHFVHSANLRFQPQYVSPKCEHQPRYLIIRSLLI
jgi:hypothetical protein